MAMMKPTLDELLEKAENRYTLVVAASKRARQLMEEEMFSSKVNEDNNDDQVVNEDVPKRSVETYNRAKMVRYALEDIASGKIVCKPK